MGAPYLGVVLQVECHKNRLEGPNSLLCPTGHPSFNAPQYAKLVMPSFSSTGIPKSFSTGLLSVYSPLSFGTGDCPDTGVLVLVAACEGHMGPLLRPAKVPVGGIPSLQQTNCTSHLGALCQLPVGALTATACVIITEMEQYQSQHASLRDATFY